MRTIIVDLDGTLADNSHRQHLLPDWDAFFLACEDDLPITRVICLARYLWHRGHPIHIFSGRGAIAEAQTRRWLRKHSIHCDWLTMRPVGDTTPDEVLKIRWAQEFGYTPGNVEFVLDDRNKVVKAWRDNGFTCLQLTDGNF